MKPGNYTWLTTTASRKEGRPGGHVPPGISRIGQFLLYSASLECENLTFPRIFTICAPPPEFESLSRHWLWKVAWFQIISCAWISYTFIFMYVGGATEFFVISSNWIYYSLTFCHLSLLREIMNLEPFFSFKSVAVY